MESYKCPVCENTDLHSIGYLNGKFVDPQRLENHNRKEVSNEQKIQIL